MLDTYKRTPQHMDTLPLSWNSLIVPAGCDATVASSSGWCSGRTENIQEKALWRVNWRVILPFPAFRGKDTRDCKLERRNFLPDFGIIGNITFFHFSLKFKGILLPGALLVKGVGIDIIGDCIRIALLGIHSFKHQHHELTT